MAVARAQRSLLKARLLDQIGQVGANVSEACELVGVNRATFYRWRATDHEFDAAIEAAECEASQSALRRAIAELAAERETH